MVFCLSWEQLMYKGNIPFIEMKSFPLALKLIIHPEYLTVTIKTLRRDFEPPTFKT